VLLAGGSSRAMLASARFSCLSVAFSDLMLLVGHQEGHIQSVKTEWWGAGVVISLG